MGLMDKVKQQAEQALTKAQQGVTQGQAKLDQVQTKRRADALLRNLGAAYYAQVRQGGPVKDVDAAMLALDEHAKLHGEIDANSTPVGSSTVGESAPGGSYNLDDV